MKKLILVLFAALCTCGATAQTDSSHLTFMGIPIDGPLDAFVQKLKQKGCSPQYTQDGVIALSGDFASYKNCRIIVVSKIPKQTVYGITVFLPAQNTWSNLSSSYFSLKEMLSQKYGDPTESTETFQSYVQPEDDRTKMRYVKTDRCEYNTLFETPYGKIKLWIAYIASECVVSLAYLDKTNYSELLQQAYDDL